MDKNEFNLIMLGRKLHDCQTYCDYLRDGNRRADRLFEGNEEIQIQSMYELYNSLTNKNNELLKRIVRFESILLQKKDFSKGSN